MDAVDSDNRVTAKLSRLIAGAELDMRLCEAALRGAGSLCNFEAGCDLRARCLAAAAAVAAGSCNVADKVSSAIDHARRADAAGLDVVGCAVEVTLMLLEGASTHCGPPAEGQCDVVYVTGQHGWVHREEWVLKTARIAAVLGAKGVIHSSAQSIGDLQRKVVLAAPLACAPITTLFVLICVCGRTSLFMLSTQFFWIPCTECCPQLQILSSSCLRVVEIQMLKSQLPEPLISADSAICAESALQM